MRRDHAEAFGCFSSAAERDDEETSSKALGMLARCHEEGWGTPVDRVAALRCYQAAMASGDCWAALNLGMIHTENDRVAEAHAAFETAIAHASPHCLPAIMGALNNLADARIAGLIADAMSSAQQVDRMQKLNSVPYYKRDELNRCKTAWLLKFFITAVCFTKLFTNKGHEALSENNQNNF